MILTSLSFSAAYRVVARRAVREMSASTCCPALRLMSMLVPGLLPDVGEGLLHGSALARVGDVEPRLPVQIVSCGFEGKDPPLVSDAAHAIRRRTPSSDASP